MTTPLPSAFLLPCGSTEWITKMLGETFSNSSSGLSACAAGASDATSTTATQESGLLLMWTSPLPCFDARSYRHANRPPTVLFRSAGPLLRPGLGQLRGVLPEVGLELDSHRVEHARDHGIETGGHRELDIVVVIEVLHRLAVGLVAHPSRGYAFREVQRRLFPGIEFGRHAPAGERGDLRFSHPGLDCHPQVLGPLILRR